MDINLNCIFLEGVSIATVRTTWVRFLAWQDFPFLYSFQTDTWAHPASYPVGTAVVFPRDKVSDTRSSQLTSIQYGGQEW
jgi:hypothetical protein